MPHVRFLTAVSLAAAFSAAEAQQPQPLKTEPATFSMAKEYRAVQLSALKAQRKLLLSMADSMPERLYRDKATPAQRDFAQQVQHIVGAGGFLAGRFFGSGPRPRPDTAAVLNTRAGLKAYIDSEYDFLEGLLAAQTDADRDVRAEFFGGAMVPKWQIWDELNQHAMWTAGQIVANFRKHGMAPPAFLFF
jgi:hypothetical protein